MNTKKGTWRRIFAGILTTAMLGTMFPAAVSAQEKESTGKLLAEFSFDNVENGFSGSAAKAQIKGSYELKESKDARNGQALYLDGNASNYLTVTKEDGSSFLAGKQELTFSYDAKPERNDTSWVFYAAPDEKAQQGDYEHYIGSMHNNGNIKVERYHNTGVRPSTSDYGVGKEWMHIDIVFSKKDTSVYLNGEKKVTTASGYALTDILGDKGILLIGRANWGNGEGYQGFIDNFRVYDGVLSDGEIINEYVSGMPVEQVLQKAQETLTIPEAGSQTVSCNFVSALTLVESVIGGNVQVTWKSSDASVISDDGKITAPEKEKKVTMTATLSYDGKTAEKRFELTVLPEGETEYSITVDEENEGAEISQELIGLFFEDINSAADGGLNPEMVKNNSFETYFNVTSTEEQGRGNQYSWKLHWNSDHDERFVVKQDPNEYMNANNTNYAEITGDITLLNGGFAPMSNPDSAAMAVEKDQDYDFSVWTKASSNYKGVMKVQLVNESGEALSQEETIPFVRDGKWEKAQAVLTGTQTQKGKIKLSISGAQDTDVLYMDMVSLSSQNTYGYGNPNYSCGKGLRKDLVEKLIALNPGFIRFPGGCIVEGNSGRESYYNWEWSVGPLEERKPIANHWASDNGSYTSKYSYMQSFGFGYHEILTLCEEMGAEPFPILSAGVFCQFANEDKMPAASGEELDKFAQHATHLIDYCWGDPNSTDAVQKEWASKRVANGHEEPFDLNYVGIGNENWRDKYLNNFEYIKDYVEEYVAKHYPGRKITIISSSGPGAEDGSYRYAWDWFHEKDAGETLVDEHYYQSKEFMLNKDNRYDFYRRLEDGGSNVFVGEYATHLGSRNNNLESAICDAAYMTGFERNGDIVRHASYAPLFEKIGGTNWTQNMIHFDDYESFGTPNYYVQQMYANNYGKKVIPTLLEKKGENYTQNTGSPVIGTWSTSGYVTNIKVTREDGKVLLNDNLTSNTAGWEALPGSNGEFTIADGRMTFTRGNGMNCVWLPEAADNPEWHDYKVEATVVKTGGEEGFLVGAGAKDENNLYWYNIGGWNNTMNVVERKSSDIGTMVLGNKFTYGFTPVVTNEEMKVTFNYGVNDRLEAGYTSPSADMSDDFSGNLRPYQNDIYQVSTKDEQYIYLKLVNHDNYAKGITVNYPGVSAKEAEIICLSGNAADVNGIGNETAVPKTAVYAIEGGALKYEIPAMSFSIIKVAYSDVTVDKSKLESEIKGAVDEARRRDYTSTSWSAYDAALVKAEAVYATSKSTQEEVDAAVNQLKQAKEDLVLRGGGTDPERPFEDVDMETGNWYYDAVYYNFDRGIMNGINKTHFEPLSNLARAQFAIILYNMEGKPAVACEPKFKDVAEGQWYTSAILWAGNKKIVTGYTDGSERFGWGDNILREQMAVMMYRYAKEFKEYDVSDNADFDNFTDAASVSGYAKEAMKWAVGAGIITGKDLDKDGTPESIDPLGNASRAECAIIIQRFLEKYN